MIRRPPRSPPSPTRRSSDPLLRRPALQPVHRLGEDLLRGEELLTHRLVGPRPAVVEHAGAGGPCPHAAVARADRKSTRLNSSHSQISYAVFCLKKKNTTALTNNFSSPLLLSFRTGFVSYVPPCRARTLRW